MEPTVELAQAGGPVILLVDDDPLVREAFVRLLEANGYAVVTASSAVRALGLLPLQRFHAVIADLEMPQVDGIELLARVQASHPECARALLTASSPDELPPGAAAGGRIHAVLQKGMPREALCAELRRILPLRS